MKQLDSITNDLLALPAGAASGSRPAGWLLWRALLLGLVLAFGAARPAQAGHFRYGSLTWRTIATDPSKQTVQFKVSQSWRRSFSAFENVTVGSTVLTDVLDFGDGSTADIVLTVTSVDVAGDSFYGEAAITHTYAAAGNYRAFFTNCCRLSTLANNANGSWFVNSLVNAGTGNNSPVSTVAPMVNLATGQNPASFLLPVSDPDGDAVTFALATVADFSGNPFQNAPTLAVDARTGRVTFNTAIMAVGQLYNAVIKVSDGQTSILVDFIISITATSTAPVFDYSLTPPNGFVYRLAPGQPLTFGVRATDSDPGDQVRLQAFGLPLGAGTAPALPTTANPVQSTFTWTPTVANLGTSIINFVAQDLAGVQASTSVTIEVTQRPVFDVPPTPAYGSVVQATPGTALSFPIQASDPDATDRVSLVSATGLPAGAGFSPALPTVAANPSRTQLSWTPAVANWGPHAVTLTARDTHGDQATHTLNFLINSAPAFTSQPGNLALVAGQPFRYNISATDPDLPYGDRLALEGPVLPAWLRLVDNGNGTATLSGTPGPADLGRHPVTLAAEDTYHHGNTYGHITQQFVLNVTAPAACAVRLTATGTNPNCLMANSGHSTLAVAGATAPLTYAWTGPNGYRSAAPSPSGLAAGTYAVTVTDANRCTATTRLTLTAPTPAVPPTVAVALSGSAVAGMPANTLFLGYGPQTATLTASGGVRYQWSPSAGLSNAGIANPVFAPTAAGTYTFTVTAFNAAGCGASASVTLRVLDARCGNNPNNPKVLICHNGHEICISPNAVPAHLAHRAQHGDYLGGCGSPPAAQPAAQPAAVLLEAFPNPLTAGSAVRLRVGATAPASVKIYNQMGYLMATLFNGVAEGGRDYLLPVKSAQWPAGLYLCHVVSQGQTRVQRLVVVK
ncbi:putative Ig domain-containing protein [uncultured Hymenobacter sp.]|uniref:putative Ig domain-containing protein n=1 Tax=uncultured Hymenobacter sp. TaxID=170016 RepID=UPI0035C9CF72